MHHLHMFPPLLPHACPVSLSKIVQQTEHFKKKQDETYHMVISSSFDTTSGSQITPNFFTECPRRL